MTISDKATNTVIGPVSAGNRIEAIDTMRGFALLGILVMNITGMALPGAASFNPMVYGGSTGVNFGAWVFAHLFFDLKMMGIFSMLFGAGVILMTERAEAAGRPFGRIYYRRILWLLVMGILHAYLLWYGDILVTYALCGLILYLFRRRSVRTLILAGISVLVIGALLSVGYGLAKKQLRDDVKAIETRVAAGEEMTPQRQALIDQWDGLREAFAPTPEEIGEVIDAMRGGADEVLQTNVRDTIVIHTLVVPFFLFWRAMALMLLGMALMKAGVFTAQRSRTFYWYCMIVGFGLGLPVISFGIRQWRTHDFDFISHLLIDNQYNYFASVLVSIAYVGLAMLLCKSGRMAGFRTRLADVGRMALTNYLLQSVIGVAIFYGYGLALFGRVGRFNLWWFILGVWIFQLILSPWWLKRFQFGPAEWLWRTLTYWRRQPMRVVRDR